jgi:AcrR family transcriptional regulator
MPTPRNRVPYDIDAIVDIAVLTFLQHGYDGTSMDRLADAAGIRKASLYHHVNSKEEQLRLGIKRALDASYAVFDEPGATGGDAVDRLRYVIRRQCEVLGEHVAEPALMTRARGNTETERWVLQQRRALNQRVQKYVQDAIDDGFLDARLDSHVATRLMFGTITSTVDWYRTGGRLRPSDLASQVDLLLFRKGQ